MQSRPDEKENNREVPSSAGLPERSRTADMTNRGNYDPHVPDETVLQELQENGAADADEHVVHEEAFRSTAGEELRPKDGTLDGGSAR